ncbi:Yip1 family protein [Roseinatronobacter alkalisoli]|uniref:Yip1 family protein n=1 Tax=Roseinatronobacter alkalisoli TaxID=3028235 RepID=A0ABT5TBP4_9RHOB|nr:Yip1 family protein [Roseinatronobacter sp. HJB301]MDD7972532.1 Yip1 family protein [Roseinatronobacter sp. HJB301]
MATGRPDDGKHEGTPVMQLNIAAVSALVRLTLTRPREAAARLIALDVPDDARWLGFVIVVVLSVFLGQVSVLLMEDGEAMMGGGLLFMAMFQTSVLLGMVVAVQGVGRALGGKGSFPDTLLLLAWLQFVMLVLQFVQIAALILIPPLFGMITLLALAVFLWLLTNFVLVLHGFTSGLKVFVGIIFSFFGVAMALAFLLVLLGFGPEGAM